MKSRWIAVAGICVGLAIGVLGAITVYAGQNSNHLKKVAAEKLVDHGTFAVISKFIEIGEYRMAGALLANAMSSYPNDERLRTAWLSISQELEAEENAEAGDGLSSEQYRKLAAMLSKNAKSIDALSGRIALLEKRGGNEAPIEVLMAREGNETLPDISFAGSSSMAGEAEKLYAAGKYSQAYELYYSICGKDPNDVKALTGAAKSLLALPNSSQAKQQSKIVSLLERAAKLSPTEREPRMLLKTVYYRMRDYVKAREWLVSALKIDKGDCDYWVMAGNICLETSDYDQADEYFTKAIECDAEKAEAYIARTELALKRGNYAEAQAYANSAAKLEPNNERVVICVARAKKEANDSAGAATVYEAAYFSFGRNDYAATSARLYLEAGDYRKSIMMAEASLEKNECKTNADRERAVDAYAVWSEAATELKKDAGEILGAARKGLKINGRSSELAIIFSDHANSLAAAKEAYAYLRGAESAKDDKRLAASMEKLLSKYPEAEGIR